MEEKCVKKLWNGNKIRKFALLPQYKKEQFTTNEICETIPNTTEHVSPKHSIKDENNSSFRNIAPFRIRGERLNLKPNGCL
jgi:hypothetical protein